MRNLRAVAGALTVLVMLTPGVRSATADVGLRAGVGIADATWHVGTGSGQYANNLPDGQLPNAFGVATGEEVDPHNHGMTQEHSYGVQSRLTYRALVVEGSNGKRVALVKSDSYLAQDYLVRRAAQILAEKGTSGIGYEQILLHASHNHSSPYYTSPSWGVWLFQDMFDIRAFEYHARAMASAIEQAAADLRPARMGATTVEHKIYKGNIAGATITDDGTPGGYPDTHADFGLTVLRFDDVTDPNAPAPLAAWVNFGQHPESNDSYALISADFLGPLERFVERDLGAPLIFSQGDVGSAEGPYDRSNNTTLPDGVWRAWAHVGHAQTERGARYLADSIVEAWDNIGRGNAAVPFAEDSPVDYIDGWVPGPLSHPYPSVSNCRTETTVESNPGAPVLGLPDCERAQRADPNNMVWENLRAHGLPVPDHYDAPGFTGVEENMRLRLQAIRIGEVLLGSCACEAQVDLILNFESRADNVVGNIFDGYDWGLSCEQNEDTTWTCSHPQIATTTVSDARYKRMQAQVHNDAAGWDAPENAIAANAEPDDVNRIWGNFTKEELSPSLGYALPVGVGHAGDYTGYTVSYREYMSRDHYRKALTSYGPHTADYMVTRLVRMAAALKGGPAVVPEPHDATAQADEARQVALSTALGLASSAAYEAWLAALPSDIGPAEPLVQPADVTRFSAATFTWRGGSNAVDNPRARVERRTGTDTWVPYADQSGEVQTMVEFPKGAAGVVDTYAGNQQWRWTANFEAFDAFPRTVHPSGQTPDGTYRFVVDGVIRLAGVNTPYHFESDAFHIGPWEGVGINDARVEEDGSVSFVVTVAYPRTYTSPFRFVRDDGRTKICYTCSFRPWASTATVARAQVTVARAAGGTDVIPAALTDGRWIAPANIQLGDIATIARGGVVDSFGEINGTVVAVN